MLNKDLTFFPNFQGRKWRPKQRTGNQILASRFCLIKFQNKRTVSVQFSIVRWHLQNKRTISVQFSIVKWHLQNKRTVSVQFSIVRWHLQNKRTTSVQFSIVNWHLRTAPSNTREGSMRSAFSCYPSNAARQALNRPFAVL